MNWDTFPIFLFPQFFFRNVWIVDFVKRERVNLILFTCRMSNVIMDEISGVSLMLCWGLSPKSYWSLEVLKSNTCQAHHWWLNWKILQISRSLSVPKIYPNLNKKNIFEKFFPSNLKQTENFCEKKKKSFLKQKLVSQRFMEVCKPPAKKRWRKIHVLNKDSFSGNLVTWDFVKWFKFINS